MPYKPKGPCANPSCPNLATHGSYCVLHAPAVTARDKRPSAAKRGYGAEWRALRAKHLREYPLCQACGAAGTDVDHIVPKRLGGTDDASNLQTLCHACHSRKTARRDGGWGRRTYASK